MPDSFTMGQIEAAFTTFSWEKRGFEHPFLASFGKVTWFWHKCGVKRRMFIAEVTPHEKDPRCEKLPSIFSPKPGKTAPFVIGCNLHFCKLCNQHGHREMVHDNFRSRAKPATKRTASALADQPGAKIRECCIICLRSRLVLLCALLANTAILALKYLVVSFAVSHVRLCPSLSPASWRFAIAQDALRFDSQLRLLVQLQSLQAFPAVLIAFISCKFGVIQLSWPVHSCLYTVSWLYILSQTFLCVHLLQQSQSSWMRSRRTSTLSSSAARSLARHGSAPPAAGQAMASSAAGGTSAVTGTRRRSKTRRPRLQLSRGRRQRGPPVRTKHQQSDQGVSILEVSKFFVRLLAFYRYEF